MRTLMQYAIMYGIQEASKKLLAILPNDFTKRKLWDTHTAKCTNKPSCELNAAMVDELKFTCHD